MPAWFPASGFGVPPPGGFRAGCLARVLKKDSSFKAVNSWVLGVLLIRVSSRSFAVKGFSSGPGVVRLPYA